MARRSLILAMVLGAILIGGCAGPCLPPIADFMACPDGSRNGFDMQFSSTSQASPGHGLVFFSWNFGDGATIDDYYGWVSHRFLEPGTYTVSLTVTDDRGVKASVEQSVVVSHVVELSHVSFTTGYPSRAEGEIANQSSLYLYSASIKVKFYDQDGVRVGETVVDVQSIDPGERVRFIAEAPDGVGPIASAVAFVQSFAAECSGGPVVPPVYVDK